MATVRRRVGGLAAAFVAILLACHAVVEVAGLRFYQPTADASVRALEVFRRAPLHPEVVFVGSSQMRRGVSAPLCEREAARALGRPVSAFNLGLQAGTAPAYALITRDLLTGEHRPRLVVVGVGPRDLNANSPQHQRVLRHLAAPWDLLGPLGPRWSSPSELVAVPALAVRAPATLLQLLRPETEEERELCTRIIEARGSFYDADDSVQAGATAGLGVAERTRRRAKHVREALLRDFDLDGRGLWAVTSLVEGARAGGSDVVLVGMPRSDAFARQAYRRGEEDAVRAAMQGLGDVAWVEATGPDWAELEGSFYDGDHLAPAGAAVFTRLLVERVVVPRLSAAPDGAVPEMDDHGNGVTRGEP